MSQAVNTLIVSSPEFTEGNPIPVRFTCNGESISPTIVIDQVPEGTESMVLIMEDPDAPKGIFTHWVLFDIQPTNSISENTGQGVSGLNSRGQMGYVPPCPPSGVHRYYIHIYALQHGLDLKPGATREAVEQAMQPLVLANGSLMGRYGQPSAESQNAASRMAASQSNASENSGSPGSTAATEHYHPDRTTVDETGAGTWTTDKKVQH